MQSQLYNGTSAYKIDEYYEYTENASKNREKQENVRAGKLKIARRKLVTVTAAVFALAIAFLYSNVLLMRTASEYEALNEELDDIKVRNTQVAFEIASGIDLKAVEEKAKNEFGMQKPETHQNVYVEVVQSDYAESMVQPREEAGMIDKMISGFKSFLAYIG